MVTRRIKVFTALVLSLVLCMLTLSSCSLREATDATDYMHETYDKSMQRGRLFASKLCIISDKDKAKDDEIIDSTLSGYALFSTDPVRTETWYKVNKKLYPASTTKLLTALMALKYGKLDRKVTVSKHAVEDLEEGSSVAGLKVGDVLTLRDLLYGLLMQSGNDAAVAIAEYLGDGSEMDFVKKMNKEAKLIGATNTHFVNSNGLHDKNHYTTVYDLYLMFTECLKYKEFRTIIKAKDYNTSIVSTDGTMRSINFAPTNFYALGDAEPPSGVTVIGGKTGTTDEAGSCLVLLSKNKSNTPYISIIMGAGYKELLYADMNELMEMEND